MTILTNITDCPFYGDVPKEFFANLNFRDELIRYGCESKENAEELWIACRRDPLFYINAFCYTFDPRLLPNYPVVPFITWEFQDAAILDLLDAIRTGEDRLIEKSRDMGASWITLLCFEYLWHFEDMLTFLLVSRVEDLVDKTGDPDALMWKVDFLHKHQPKWLKPSISRTHLHILNDDNGSTIDGAATTGDVGRGGRRTATLLDEFASVEQGSAVLKATRDMTNCRLFNSTPKGTGNSFYDLRQRGDIKRLRFHWTDHPEKSLGLYLDSDGKPRSPWYDLQCKRVGHPMEIAQELDIDYLASDFQFFDETVLDAVIRECCPAYMTGEMEYDPDTLEFRAFHKGANGRLKLWINPDLHDELPEDRDFIIAADIATGTGASNSVLAIGDCLTREIVGKFVCPNTNPNDLARMAIALAKWFHGKSSEAFIIWEANGPGRNFGDQILKSGHGRFYLKTDEKSLTRKQSTIPGWWATRESKLGLLGAYREALKARTIVNRDQESVAECRQYVFSADGQVLHAKSRDRDDPSKARENHGDRVIADALLNKAMDAPQSAQVKTEQVVPVGCLAWRIQQVKKKVTGAWRELSVA